MGTHTMTTRLPEAFEVTMPSELTRLNWAEVNQQVDVETMWVDRATTTQYVAMEPRNPTDIEWATRQRFSISGTALGAHPEVGDVTYEDGQTPTTRVRVVLAFTPWVLA